MSENSQMEEDAPTLSFRKLLRSGRIFDYGVLMGSICACWIGVSIGYPYLAPWSYNHGLTAQEVGVLFSAQPFAVALAQPFTPRIGRSYGLDLALASGLLLSALALVTFAFIPTMVSEKGSELTFWYLLVADVMAGLGEGVVETCTYAMVLVEFPDVVGQMTAQVETWIGIGTIVGPALGGTLYAKGGFAMPAASAASLLALLIVACCAWIVRRRRRARVRTGSQEKDVSALVRRPDVTRTSIAICGIFLAGFVGGSMFPLMSTHFVQDYRWSEAVVGVIFATYGVLYVVSTIRVGLMGDRDIRNASLLFTLGVWMTALSLLLCSGLLSSFKLFDRAFTTFGYLLTGVSDACLLVPGFLLLEQSAPSSWDEGRTSSALNGFYALGVGVGPLITIPLCASCGLAKVLLSACCLVGVFGVCVSLSMRPSKTIVDESLSSEPLLS